MTLTFPDTGILDRFISDLTDKRLAEADQKREELRAAYERINELEADLLECQEFIEVYVDVNDGDDGQPIPNKAMRLCSMIDESLHGPGNF